MAALTWRNVDAPQFDVRGLAVAGAGITNGFDRLAQMLQDREAQLRTEATNAAIAEGLSLQDPEAVKARLAQGTTGMDARVDARSFMEALGQHQNRLMDTSLKNEEVLNARAMSELGDEGAALLNAATTGDRGAMNRVLELAATNPLWARVAQPFMKDAAGAFGEADTRRMTGERDANTAAYQQGSLANDRARITIDRQRAAGEGAERSLRIAALKREEADRQATLEGARWGENFARNLDPRYSAEEAATLLTRTEQYRDASPARRAAMLGSVSPAHAERFALIEDERRAGSNAPAAGGMPDWMAPGQERPSIAALEAGAAAVKGQSAVAQTAMTQSYLAANPNLDIMQRVQGLQKEGKTIDFDTLVKRYESESDIFDPAGDLNMLKKRYNLSNEELASMLDVGGFKDASWMSFAHPMIGRTQGTRQLVSMAEAYAQARDKEGDITASQVELAGKTAGFTNREARLDRLLQRAARERNRNPGTLREIQTLQEELRAMSRERGQ